MARLTPGKTSTSASNHNPPTPHSESNLTTTTASTPADPDLDTPSRRSARIASLATRPRVVEANPQPSTTTTPTLPPPTPSSTAPPAPTKKPPNKAPAPTTLHKHREQGKTPVTPKRRAKREAAAFASASAEKPAMSREGKKRGDGGWSGVAVPVRSLPAKKKTCETVGSSVVGEEEEVGEKMRPPFVSRSLFFDDPRYTFFD
ncbi:uncharacterized protein BKCO1_6400020 [Diplodia corticola]|uniref:Uncharacterized protein n=1 Tax=Diplodia corticola TaxID=236234 RepID=A0A1J9QQ99_9PEZI|nr:uncharacterized protein BKCO1_6400020 [Diplodia corticola]OJD30202.1 hypothetical protein BKCO1_6400020 [Diplodia corticola]